MQQHVSLDDALPATRELFGVAIGECARIWRKRVNERLKPLALSQAAWLALWNLSRCPDGLVQAELAEHLAIEGPTLVRLLDRLERDGLVERLATREDRRCKRVVLTDAAGPVVAEVKAIIAELRAEILADIPESELEQGLKLLSQVRARLLET
jgi:MarR family transcriptional regulator, transcriptional regulator for hemolysin